MAGKKHWITEPEQFNENLTHCRFQKDGYADGFEHYFPERPEGVINLNSGAMTDVDGISLNYIVLAMSIELGKAPGIHWAKDGGTPFPGIPDDEQEALLYRVLEKYGLRKGMR